MSTAMIQCKAVVFDMAGTTVDEGNVVYKTLQQAISDDGTTVSLDEVLALGGGKEKFQAVRDILASKGVVDESRAKKVFENFRKQLESAYKESPVKALGGVVETFRLLRERGVKVVLNTGYDGKTAKGLMEKLNWRIPEDVDLLVTADDVKNSRPAPDMILRIARVLGIKEKEIAKVGDSIVDIEEGQNAGCTWSIGVTTGAHTREQLESAEPDYIIDDMNELPKIVLNA